MKRLFTFFNKKIFLLLCINNTLFSCEPIDCNYFLTCVNASTECLNSFNCNQACGKTFFAIRPQDSNSALRVLRIMNEFHDKTWGANFSIGAQQSFSGKNIGAWFLNSGNQCASVGTPTLTQSFNVNGTQLGLLPSDSSVGEMGTICLNPSLKNIISTIDVWANLESLLCGLWIRGYLTIANAKTSLDMCSTTTNVVQSGNYPAGLDSINCEIAPIQYNSIIDGFIGNCAFGNIPALNFGKMFCGNLNQTAVASIRFDLGYDWIESKNGFFNGGLSVLIPTGNRPQGHYIFEPIVGANGSWQLGATCSGKYCLHYGKNTVEFYNDTTITYLFKSKQTRVFSLRNNGPGSQYLLLKQFDLSVSQVSNGERVANILAGQANIGGNIMFDSSIAFHIFNCTGAFFDFGYNFWGRSSEKISNDICFRNFSPNNYGIKGNSSLSVTDGDSGFCIGDMSTASQSTLGELAPVDSTTVTLNVCDIDFSSPLHPFAFSNKFFAACGYSNEGSDPKTIVNVFLEGELEFGQKALNQWAINFNIGFLL